MGVGSRGVSFYRVIDRLGLKTSENVLRCFVAACYAAQNNAPVKSFSSMVSSMNMGPDPQFPDYDLICDA